MQIRINGELERLEGEQLSIAELLKVKNVESPDMVSVQVNGDIVDRRTYDDRRITEGDEIDFLYFMGGGASK